MEDFKIQRKKEDLARIAETIRRTEEEIESHRKLKIIELDKIEDYKRKIEVIKGRNWLEQDRQDIITAHENLIAHSEKLIKAIDEFISASKLHLDAQKDILNHAMGKPKGRVT